MTAKNTKTPEEIAADKKAAQAKRAKTIADKKAAAEAAKKGGAAPVAGGEVAPAKTTTRVLTQEDFDKTPNLLAEGFKVGDTVEIEDENPAAPAPKNAPAAPAKTTDSVDILNGRQYIRTYSEEVHGDEFLDLANGLAEREGYQVVDSSSIESVAVSYRAVDKKTGVQYATSRVFSEAANGEDFKDQALAFKNNVNADTVTV